MDFESHHGLLGCNSGVCARMEMVPTAVYCMCVCVCVCVYIYGCSCTSTLDPMSWTGKYLNSPPKTVSSLKRAHHHVFKRACWMTKLCFFNAIKCIEKTKVVVLVLLVCFSCVRKHFSSPTQSNQPVFCSTTHSELCQKAKHICN